MAMLQESGETPMDCGDALPQQCDFMLLAPSGQVVGSGFEPATKDHRSHYSVFTNHCAIKIFVAAFSGSEGDPFRLVYGYDSFGNTCDADNSGKVIPGVRYAGWNLKGRPYLFFMNIRDPDHSLRICVNTCPEMDIRSPKILFEFSQQTGSLLCRYDLGLGFYTFANRTLHGPCPVLPIYKSEPLLNRCIPRNLTTIEDWLETNIANNIIAYLNKSNIFQKALRDLYDSWNIIIALCFLAVGRLASMRKMAGSLLTARQRISSTPRIHQAPVIGPGLFRLGGSRGGKEIRGNSS
ncbi:choline transporter-like protein 1 [Plakobranchus ocellatus]|uniref:Choline transporter-like protein 1 n=1 Tax=Plakobranchus ocellatus TaxID=259542 RepID=A0AAV4ASE9_9GAST|nr:choline transporter-like protein 1 [Plakobranchus ocellatus]